MTSKEIDKKWQWVFENYQTMPMEALNQTLHIGAEEGAESFVEELEKVAVKTSKRPEEFYTLIYLEYLYFYLTILDRVALQELDSEKRDQFMLEFGTMTLTVATKMFFSEPESVFQSLFSNYLQAKKDYASYNTMLPPKNNPFSDEGLSRQLGKKIGSILNMNSSNINDDIKLDAMTYAPIAGFQVMVDFSEWIKGPIMSMGLKQYKTIKLIDDKKQQRIAKTLKDDKKKEKK